MTPAAALAPDVLAPQATPSFHKWAISDSQGIQLLVLETSGHVALSADPLYIREGVVTVPLPKGVGISVQVHADVVTLAGDLSLPSCAVTIVANRLVVEAGQARPGIATLDVSGADGKPPADPKPAPGQAVTGEKGAGRPLVRREDLNGYRWTGPGAPGGQGASGTPGAKGDTGNAGQRGGRISIACGSIEGAPLDLAARGGSGGPGQAGQGGGKGGRGGPGADADAGTPLSPTDGGPGGTGGAAGPPGEGGRGEQGGHVTVWIGAYDHKAYAGDPVTVSSVDGGSSGPLGAPGQPGAGGERGNGGAAVQHAWWRDASLDAAITQPGNLGPKDGDPGAPWTPVQQALGRAASGTRSVDTNASLNDRASYATPGWLQLMLEKIRLEFLAADPIARKDAYAAVGLRLDWLVSTLSTCNKGMAADEPGKGTIGALLHQAWAMNMSHSSGLDVFGLAPHWVPAMSVNAYLDDGLDGVNALRQLEDKVRGFWTATTRQAAARDSLALVQAGARDRAAKVGGLIEQARKDIADAAAALDAAEKARAVQRASLETALRKVESAVTAAFDLNPATLLNCLSQLAFMGGSFGGSAALAVSQAGTAVLDASTNVLNDYGQSLNKKYLVAQLKSFAGDDDLKADLRRNAQGFIDDRSSYAYVADLGKVQALIAQFAQRTDVGVPEAARALRAYVETIDKRNALVDRYNDALRRLVAFQGEQDRTSRQQADIATRTVANTDPALGLWASYFNGLADQMRSLCLGNLARAYRASSFWSMAEPGSFHHWVAGNPGAIDATVLGTAFREIKAKLRTTLDGTRKTPNRFPASEAAFREPGGGQWLPGGVLVVLDAATHPDVFKQLSAGDPTEFEVLPATRASKAPAALDAPTAAARAVALLPTGGPAVAPPDTNPFHSKANVRLTKIRVWAEGMITSTHRHQIVLEHRGQERFRTAKDDPFPPDKPGAQYLEHARITVPFAYNAAVYAFHPDKGFAAAALEEGVGNQDGDLQFNAPPAPGQPPEQLPISADYAPIGPFAVWRLRIDGNDNPGLDLGKLSRIVIDFHGYHDTFA